MPGAGGQLELPRGRGHVAGDQLDRVAPTLHADVHVGVALGCVSGRARPARQVVSLDAHAHPPIMTARGGGRSAACRARARHRHPGRVAAASSRAARASWPSARATSAGVRPSSVRRPGSAPAARSSSGHVRIPSVRGFVQRGEAPRLGGVEAGARRHDERQAGTGGAGGRGVDRGDAHGVRGGGVEVGAGPDEHRRGRGLVEEQGELDRREAVGRRLVGRHAGGQQLADPADVAHGRGLGEVERAELADGVDHRVEAPVASQQEGADPRIVASVGLVRMGSDGGDRRRRVACEDRLDQRHGRTVPRRPPPVGPLVWPAVAPESIIEGPLAPRRREHPVPWSIRWFKVVAVAEAVSYLVLLGASVAKHVFDMPGAVPIMGPIHGLIFLTYLWLALLVREELGWRLSTTLTVVVAAVIPLGGLYVERRRAGGGDAGRAPRADACS